VVINNNEISRWSATGNGGLANSETHHPGGGIEESL
jgi:hypothetical protein